MSSRHQIIQNHACVAHIGELEGYEIEMLQMQFGEEMAPPLPRVPRVPRKPRLQKRVQPPKPCGMEWSRHA